MIDLLLSAFGGVIAVLISAYIVLVLLICSLFRINKTREGE